MRFSRGCYDKFHRCPGWIGGGPKFAKVQRCRDGRIQIDYDDKWRLWKFQRCDKCDVVVWPYVTRYLSVEWQWDNMKWLIRRSRDAWYRREKLMEKWWGWHPDKPAWLRDWFAHLFCLWYSHEKNIDGFCDWCGWRMD